MAETIIKLFDTPYDFLQWATNAPCMWKGDLSSRKERNRDWAGTATYEEAYQLAAYGWPEGLKLLSDKIELVEKIVTPEARPKIRYDVAGYYPNPARAAAGEIFNMAMPVRPENRTQEIIKIRYSIARAARVDSDQIIAFGAALCSYINMLEKQGSYVELEAVAEFKPNDGGPDLSFQFPLKKAGNNLSAASIVFWLAHPAALRRICFSAFERLNVERFYQETYGYPRTTTEVPKGTLYLTINDAGRTFAEGIESIRKKHMSILDKSSPLLSQLRQINLG